MMNIGILTFHCAHNYGAVLQAYALQEYIQSLGHNVYIIDYRPDFLIKPYAVFNRTRIKSNNLFKSFGKFLIELLILRRRSKRYRSFDLFIKNEFRLLPINKTDKLDVIVIGSDQVWNPKFNYGKFDETYLGENTSVFNKDIKIISYAASSGVDSFSKEDMSQLMNHLLKFNAISVRELSLKKIIEAEQPFFNVSQVLDPTLLINPDIFRSKITGKYKNKKPYLLIYQVKYDKNTRRIAQYIAKQKHLEIIEVASSIQYRCDENILWSESPLDLLELFAQASYVVTTSFHGTALSLIFEKPFYTLKFNSSVDSRVLSLLDELNLSHRHIDIYDIPKIEEIDYEKINIKLSELRELSRKFLNNSLH